MPQRIIQLLMFGLAGLLLVSLPNEHLPSLAWRIHFGAAQWAFGVSFGIWIGEAAKKGRKAAAEWDEYMSNDTRLSSDNEALRKRVGELEELFSHKWFDPECGHAGCQSLVLKNRAEQAEAQLAVARDGNRPLPYDRDYLGRLVREAWVRWAYTQPNPKSSWLVDYDELAEPDKEADRQIGECIARWTIIGDAARARRCQESWERYRAAHDRGVEE